MRPSITIGKEKTYEPSPAVRVSRRKIRALTASGWGCSAGVKRRPSRAGLVGNAPSARTAPARTTTTTRSPARLSHSAPSEAVVHRSGRSGAPFGTAGGRWAVVMRGGAAGRPHGAHHVLTRVAPRRHCPRRRRDFPGQLRHSDGAASRGCLVLLPPVCGRRVPAPCSPLKVSQVSLRRVLFLGFGGDCTFYALIPVEGGIWCGEDWGTQNFGEGTIWHPLSNTIGET